jgi:hypothetical protein
MDRVDAALAAVRGRIANVASGENVAGILTEDALRDVKSLLAVSDPDSDLEVAHVLGIFH